MYNKFLPSLKFKGFNDIFDDFHFHPMHFNLGSEKPKVNISETDKAYEISADLPGVQKEDIKVSIENNVLTIYGERKKQAEEKGKNWHRVESSYGSFERHIQLSDNIKEDSISATFKDGVLYTTIEKKAKTETKSGSRQIEIK